MFYFPHYFLHKNALKMSHYLSTYERQWKICELGTKNSNDFTSHVTHSSLRLEQTPLASKASQNLPSQSYPVCAQGLIFYKRISSKRQRQRHPRCQISGQKNVFKGVVLFMLCAQNVAHFGTGNEILFKNSEIVFCYINLSNLA